MVSILQQQSPHPSLQLWVESFRHYKATYSDKNIFMIPEGIVEVIFQLESKTTQSFIPEKDWNWRPQAFIGGLHNKAYFFRIHQSGHMFSVRFKAGGFSFFNKTPVHLLKNQLISPVDIWGKEGSNLEDAILNTSNFLARIKITETFLQKAFVSHRYPRFLPASNFLADSYGKQSIQAIAQHFNYSPSRFRQIFNSVVGCSPKEFQCIHRLHQAIKYYPSANNLTDLAYHLGYFDQAHFIRDCKKVTGLTPSKFLSTIAIT